jgi:hypothetical protein
MTEGFASDITGDDTVMDSPEATISIDISQLPPRQALAIAREAGLDQQEEYVVGALMQGNNVRNSDFNDAEFHIPVEAALTALEELGITESNQPAESEDSSTPSA